MKKTIRESLVAGFVADVEKLNKRARKLHMPELLLVLGQVEQRQVMHHDHCTDTGLCMCVPFVRLYREVEIQGLAPVLNGYKLAAVVNHGEGNLVRSLVEDLPEVYRSASPLCEHCQTTRKRNDTFVLLKDGQYKQVGRSCLADYLRSSELAEQMLAALEFWKAVEGSCSDDEESYGSGGPEVWNLHIVLQHAASAVRQYGYVSRKAAEESEREATADTVGASLIARKAEDLLEVSDADSLTALNAYWFAVNVQPTSDYLHNIQVLARRDYVNAKELGYASSIVAAYLKAAETAPSATSSYVGREGEKLTAEVRVQRVILLESGFGVTYLHKFQDANGNCLVWKTGTVRLEEDKTVTVTGKVKVHEEFRGVKQTVLTRCKVS